MVLEGGDVAAAAREFRSSPRTPAGVEAFIASYPMDVLAEAMLDSSLNRVEREDVISATALVLEDPEHGLSFVNSEGGSQLVVIGVTVPNEDVRTLAASQLSKMTKSTLMQFPQLVLSAVNALDDESVAVATKAQAGLVSFSEIGDDVVAPALAGPPGDALRALINGVGQQGNVTVIRAIDVLIAMAQYSGAARTEVESFVDRITGSLKTDDLLLKMNVIELLSRTAELPGGLARLNTSGAIEQLGEIMDATVEDPDNMENSILAGGIMRLIQAVGMASKVTNIEILARFLPSLEGILNMSGPQAATLQEGAISATGSLGCSAMGIQVLSSLSPQSVRTVMKFTESANVDLKVVALHAAGQMLRASPDDVESRDIFMVMESQMQGGASAYLTELLKRPFPDVNLAAVDVIEALSKRPYGMQQLSSTPGFVDALCDISFSTKAITEAKVKIASTITEAREGRILFGDGRYGRISALARSRHSGHAPKPEAQFQISTMRQ